MPYLGRGPNFGVRTVFHYLASNGDTSVSGADADGKSMSFVDGNYIDVYLNGVRLKSGEDYNTGTANTVAGLVLYESKTIPEPGQEFRFFDIRFRILQKKGNFISQLRLWNELATEKIWKLA